MKNKKSYTQKNKKPAYLNKKTFKNYKWTNNNKYTQKGGTLKYIFNSIIDGSCINFDNAPTVDYKTFFGFDTPNNGSTLGSANALKKNLIINNALVAGIFNQIIKSSHELKLYKSTKQANQTSPEPKAKPTRLETNNAHVAGIFNKMIESSHELKYVENIIDRLITIIQDPKYKDAKYKFDREILNKYFESLDIISKARNNEINNEITNAINNLKKISNIINREGNLPVQDITKDYLKDKSNTFNNLLDNISNLHNWAVAETNILNLHPEYNSIPISHNDVVLNDLNDQIFF